MTRSVGVIAIVKRTETALVAVIERYISSTSIIYYNFNNIFYCNFLPEALRARVAKWIVCQIQGSRVVGSTLYHLCVSLGKVLELYIL